MRSVGARCDAANVSLLTERRELLITGSINIAPLTGRGCFTGLEAMRDCDRFASQNHATTLPMSEEREEFLTAKQLAKILQVSESTVRRLARKRRIPSVRVTPHIIRFHLDAVREALDVPRYRIRHGEYTEPIDDAQLSFEDLTPLS